MLTADQLVAAVLLVCGLLAFALAAAIKAHKL